MRVVIIGSGGRLGAALMREYAGRFDVIGFNHVQLDLGNAGEIHAKIDNLSFDTLINAAAFTNVDLCEKERDRAFRVNAEAPKILAEICREKKAQLIHISTDYVFDGKKRGPYLESDSANPISVYGESKRAGEEHVLAVQDRQSDGLVPWRDRHLIVRASWVFGPDRPSFIDAIIKRARAEEHVDAIADKFATPTYTLDIAQMLPRLFDVDVPGGILHFANAGECSWQEYAQHALDCCHKLRVPLKARTVAPLKLADMKNFIARRPVYSVLATAKYTGLAGAGPRSWRDAVADYVRVAYSTK